MRSAGARAGGESKPRGHWICLTVGMSHEAADAAVSGESRQPPEEEPSSRNAVAIGPASAGDLDALLRLEAASFAGDRVSRRSFRRFLQAQNADLLVARVGGDVAGYVLTLMRADSRAARVYSLAVGSRYRGRGIGARLLAACEARARRRGRAAMRLEVRGDNAPALALYRERGYQAFATIPGYYADGAEALRLRKGLRGRAKREPQR